jgi:hypothetical protein
MAILLSMSYNRSSQKAESNLSVLTINSGHGKKNGHFVKSRADFRERNQDIDTSC